MRYGGNGRNLKGDRDSRATTSESPADDELKKRVRQETNGFQFDALLNGVSTVHRKAVVRVARPPVRPVAAPPARPAAWQEALRLLWACRLYVVLSAMLGLSAYLLSVVFLPSSRPARLHDRFESAEHWNLLWNGGTSKIAGRLKLNVGAGNTAAPMAESVDRYQIAGSRQSIEVVSHTGEPGKSAFIFAALTPTPGRSLEIRLDDAPGGTMIVCGYRMDGKFTRVGATRYRPGRHRYLAYHERNGLIFFECSSDGFTWGQVGSVRNPFGPAPMAMRFTLQHKVYRPGAPPTGTVVDNFNERGASRSARG